MHAGTAAKGDCKMKHRWITWILLLAVAIVLLPPGNLESVGAQSSLPEDDLFLVVPAMQANISWVDDSVITRTQYVRVNFAALEKYDLSDTAQPAGTLRLNLFDGMVLTATLDKWEVGYQGSHIWTGYVDGADYSEVVLAYRDGVMVGDIRVEQSLYQIQYITDDIHAIHEVDIFAFPPEAEPLVAPIPDSNHPELSEKILVEDGSRIDVLVVYTGDARSGAGGTTAMQNLIALAESQTNTGYSRSGVIQRIRVVHTAEVSYNEDYNLGTTLKRLREKNDGYMDDVHALRDAYSADLVVLIVNSGDRFDTAYVMTSVSDWFEEYAFSVVRRDRATAPRYTFAHEMGHNMGAHHNRGNTEGQTGAFSYSYGYRVNGVFSTIMASTNCPNGCQRINNWSNPNVTHQGYPTGVHYQASNSADNRRTLNNTRVTVANFRVPDTIPPTKASNVRPIGWTGRYTTNTTPRFRWDPASDDQSGLAGYYVSVKNWTPNARDWWVSNATTFTIPEPLSDGEYHFAVTSQDKAGNTNPANTNQRGDAPYYTFYVDTTAPANPTAANSGCTAQNNIWQRDCTAPTFTWSGAHDHGGSGVQDYQVYWGTDPNGAPAVWRTAANYTPSPIDTADGVITYYLRIATRDVLSHTATPETVFTLLYDSVAPTAAPQVNRGVDIAHSVDVLVEPRGHDRGSGVSQAHLSSNNVPQQSRPYAATLPWSLSPEDRQWHRVSVILEDAAGNRSNRYSCRICLDLYPARPASASYRLWSAGPTSAGGTLTSQSNYVPPPHSDTYRLCQTALNAGGSIALASSSYALASSIGEPAATQAAFATSASFQAQSGLLSSTDACRPLSHSFGYRLDQTVGQTPGGGLLASTSYQLHSGFQAMWPATPKEEMFTAFHCADDNEGNIYLPLVIRNH